MPCSWMQEGCIRSFHPNQELKSALEECTWARPEACEVKWTFVNLGGHLPWMLVLQWMFVCLLLCLPISKVILMKMVICTLHPTELLVVCCIWTFVYYCKPLRGQTPWTLLSQWFVLRGGCFSIIQVIFSGCLYVSSHLCYLLMN